MKKILTAIVQVLPPAVLASWISLAAAATPHIEVEALFTDAAVLQIDGKRKMLRVGQSFNGVTLLAAYSRTATVEFSGEQMVLGISRRIGTIYEETRERVVTVTRNQEMQYLTSATIHGREVPVLVDTGANVVAVSSKQADAMGLKYSDGIPSRVETASGVANAWIVTLPSIAVGEIRIENVRASVVEGDYPARILLGMSFLQHVELNESNGVLSLSRSW